MNIKNCISIVLIVISVAVLCPIVCGSNARNFLSGISGGANVVKGLVNAKVTRHSNSDRPMHTPFPTRRNDHSNLYDLSGIQKPQPVSNNASIYNQKGSTKAPDLVKMIKSNRQPVSARNAHVSKEGVDKMLNSSNRSNYGWNVTQNRTSNYKRTHPNSLTREIFANGQHVMPKINKDLMPYRINMSESMYMVQQADKNQDGFVDSGEYNRLSRDYAPYY